MQITYLIVADTLVATVITILQLLQHIVSLKLGAFVANCRLVTVSKPRYSGIPSMIPQRTRIKLSDDEITPDVTTDDQARPPTETAEGKMMMMMMMMMMVMIIIIIRKTIMQVNWKL